jgi:hypothetical protein
MTKMAELIETNELVDAPVITDAAIITDAAGSNEASGLLSADDLVSAINEAAASLTDTEVSGFTAIVLAHIAFGKILKKAKDALEHGQWTTWFEAEPKKFPFSMRKAQRAMMFADYEPELLAWVQNRQALADLAGEGQLGIEDAENFIRELKEKRKAEAKAEAEAVSDLEVVLGEYDEAASELEAILGEFNEAKAAKIIERVWDQEKRERFVATQLKAMLRLLPGAFGYDQLANLTEQLAAHLSDVEGEV